MIGRPRGSKNKKPLKTSLCHPDSPHKSNGLCGKCYYRECGPKKGTRAEESKRYEAKNKDKISKSKKARYNRDRDKILAQKFEYWTRERIHINGRKWGLKKEQIDLIPDKPERCQVCKRTDKICMDHCHERIEFRGWLCHKCNVTLGFCMDSPELLRNLADYLEESKNKL